MLDPNAVLDFIGGPSGRKFFNAQTNNIGPNVGFAWDFDASVRLMTGDFLLWSAMGRRVQLRAPQES